MHLELESRDGWPPDLAVLLKKYPREIWPGHANLGETARFWLERHRRFRALGGTLGAATAQFREGMLSAERFASFFAPRLQVFLSELEGHHQVEDLYYFPVFRMAEKRLVRGFDVLEGDHATIHAAILGVVDAANELLRRVDGDPDSRRTATGAYSEASDWLLGGLLRHLDDEEDLIVPIILDRGEETLFRS